MQNGGPPIWIGPNSAAVPDRVADYADGWIVFDGRHQGDAIADLRSAYAKRDPGFEGVCISLMDAPQEESELQRRYEASYRQFIFMVPVEDTDQTKHSLDKLARLTQNLDSHN